MAPVVETQLTGSIQTEYKKQTTSTFRITKNTIIIKNHKNKKKIIDIKLVI